MRCISPLQDQGFHDIAWYDRLFPSGSFNCAIAGSLHVNSIVRSLSYSQQAPMLFPPLQGEG
ncbi:hypothetical protein [Coleofasciculus sp. G2-EDA-02]|uniref:hypothetical protein n=1 Tax=Coleofasciculus sp. G2-EDA-02 TaxID=3069529 RepID=UPI0032F49E8E